MIDPAVSVIMPTFEQRSFLARAVRSLLRQSLPDWELLVVDDGSEDHTGDSVRPFLADPRVRYRRLPANRGLGAAINCGLALTRAPLVAYLPSDDVMDPDHLASLVAALRRRAAVLAWSGVRVGDRSALGAPDGHPLQLVQVLHARTGDRWTEREEIETDDLDRLFWGRVRARGPEVGTGRVTCEWGQHPDQRHRRIRESLDGGVNPFRARYRVRTPLRFRSSDGGMVDEVGLYRRFRDRPPPPPSPDSLRILLVGELGFHPERVVAFEERGHRLYGLWIEEPLGPQTVGPLPFGHVRDLPRSGWREAARRLRPDVVYALLGWRAIPLAHSVLAAGLGIPIVWHFKESPMRAMVRGTWPQLADLQGMADGVVYATPLERQWFDLVLPGRTGDGRGLVLDGELPKEDWLVGTSSTRLSERDGEVHTVVLGRPLGIDADVVRALAAARIHLHLYGLVRVPGAGGAWRRWLEDARRIAPGRVHVHRPVDQRGWVRELSRYDAGWLHRFTSTNGGDLLRATWDDLNYPARIPALVAAGVPLLQQRTPGSRVAAAELISDRGIGVVYRDVDELCAQLRDDRAMEERRRAVWAQRADFTFDRHVDRLLGLFRDAIR